MGRLKEKVMFCYLRDKKKLAEIDGLKEFWGAGRTITEFHDYCRRINGELINEEFYAKHKKTWTGELPHIFDSEYDKRICYDGWFGTVFDTYEGFHSVDDVLVFLRRNPGRYIILGDDETEELSVPEFRLAMRQTNIVDTASSCLKTQVGKTANRTILQPAV